MPTATCPIPAQESSQERSDQSARSYEGIEHPANPSAARRQLTPCYLLIADAAGRGVVIGSQGWSGRTNSADGVLGCRLDPFSRAADFLRLAAVGINSEDTTGSLFYHCSEQCERDRQVAY